MIMIFKLVLVGEGSLSNFVSFGAYKIAVLEEQKSLQIDFESMSKNIPSKVFKSCKKICWNKYNATLFSALTITCKSIFI